MTRQQWIKDFQSLHGATQKYKPNDATPTWIIELAVRYGRLKQAGGLRTETEFRMLKATSELDIEAVKRMSDVWKYMIVQEAVEARLARRKVPKDVPEVVKSGRPTAKAIIMALLAEKPVRSDEAIIKAVHAATFHDGFNEKQLAWYKSQLRRGLLREKVAAC